MGKPGLLRVSEGRDGLQRVAHQKFKNVGSMEVSAWRGTALPPTPPSAPSCPACSQLRQRGVPDQLEVLSARVQRMKCRRTGWTPMTLSRGSGVCVCAHPDVHAGLQPLGHSSLCSWLISTWCDALAEAPSLAGGVWRGWRWSPPHTAAPWPSEVSWRGSAGRLPGRM